MQLFSSWTGSDFLAFYSALLALAGLAAWWIPAALRPPGRPGLVDDSEGIALLAGGPDRFAMSVIADLYARGGLIAQEKTKLAVGDRHLAATPGGQVLLATSVPLALPDARKALGVHAERVAARLRRAGLLMRSDEDTRLRWLSIAPFLALLAIGIYRHRAGSALGEPTAFLSLLLALTAILAVLRYARSDPRTAAGIEVVRQLRARHDRLARAPRPGEAALAVALFGTGVLVGTPWEPVHAMRQQSGDAGSGGDSGSSDSDGGSGCGGGGCGGCGG